MFFNSAFNQDIRAWDVSTGGSFDGMFQEAAAFGVGGSISLCEWGARISGTPPVLNMFTNSGCPDTSSPDLGASPKGPFCTMC